MIPELAGYSFTILLAGLFMAFPGCLVVNRFLSLGVFSKVVLAVFTSLGFWVCVSWFIGLADLPLNYSVAVLQLGFISYIFFQPQSWPRSFFAFVLRPKRWPRHLQVLAVIIILFIFPLFIIDIPPGCDTTMHGYITRLILNNNGLPHSYRPILPVDYFGSYSAGYHILTAIFAGFQLNLLRHAILLIAILTYPVTLLGMVFLLRNFFPLRIAVYSAVIFFSLNCTIQDVITWGGNPSMLAFGFSLFSAGALLHALKHKETGLFFVAALTTAAVLLIHAIPAITFVYLMCFVVPIALTVHRNKVAWMIPRLMAYVLLCALLLLPFLLHFKNDNSPALITMIKNWQHEMMGNKLGVGLTYNAEVVSEQISERIGQFIMVLSGVSVLVSLYFKRFKEVGIVALIAVYVFLLILNSAYWVLTFSELLYPERVVYFLIACLSVFFGYALMDIEARGFTFSVFTRRITLYGLILVTLLGYTAIKVFYGSKGLTDSDRIACTRQVMASFKWIDNNTEPDAVLRVNYGDVGMWIPTFTNRMTSGTHMHFIHIVKHVHDSVDASPGPKYIFVTKKDMLHKIWSPDFLSARKVVFFNDDVTIYK